jgi:hypothetical protein
MCREFRSLHDQYHEYFSAEKFLDPDSLALARSVFEKFQVFTFQPHWIFYFVLLIKYTQWGFESRTRAESAGNFSPYRSSIAFPFFQMITSSKIWEKLFESRTQAKKFAYSLRKKNRRTKSSIFYLSECRDSNPDRMLPKHECYRYTTLRYQKILTY